MDTISQQMTDGKNIEYQGIERGICLDSKYRMLQSRQMTDMFGSIQAIYH